MLVKFPRRITGEELVGIIKASVEELSNEGYYISRDNTVNAYKLGSIEKVLESESIEVAIPLRRPSNWLHRIFYPKQASFKLPKLKMEWTYTEIRLDVINGYNLHGPEHMYGSALEEATPLLERLLERVGNKITEKSG